MNKQPATEPTLASFLSPAQREVFNAVQGTAQREGVSVYLVGGAVRDWLMGQPVGDLDFVVEGDAISFAQQLHQQHGGSVQVYEKFHTATWTSYSLHTDIVTARRETYARPAVLPDVTPASIEEDVWRRDFTINTIALRLSDAALLDPFDGRADLQRQLIRALHARSFIDDPTRMLRAARYAARLGFTVEPQTRQWIAAGVPYFKDLTGERIKYDMELIFDLPQPEDALAIIDEWGVFKTLGIIVPERERLQSRFARASEQRQTGAWDMASLKLSIQQATHAVGWGALMYNLGQMSASRWINLIPFTAEVRDALVSLGVLSTLSSGLFANTKPSVQSALLSDFSGLALLIGWLCDSNADKRRAMHNEWHAWRKVQPVTSGDDLRARGLPPGPRYRELLTRLRNAWLDGEVHSAAEELALLEKLLKGVE